MTYISNANALAGLDAWLTTPPDEEDYPECHDCNGTGEYQLGEDCETCKGTGQLDYFPEPPEPTLFED